MVSTEKAQLVWRPIVLYDLYMLLQVTEGRLTLSLDNAFGLYQNFVFKPLNQMDNVNISHKIKIIYINNTTL